MKVSKFIKTCRQYVTYEFNNSVLYPRYPNMRNINSVQSIENTLLLADNKSNQMNEFYQLLQEGDYCYPMAGTIHAYLKKHDLKWYTNDFVGKKYFT